MSEDICNPTLSVAANAALSVAANVAFSTAANVTLGTVAKTPCNTKCVIYPIIKSSYKTYVPSNMVNEFNHHYMVSNSYRKKMYEILGKKILNGEIIEGWEYGHGMICTSFGEFVLLQTIDGSDFASNTKNMRITPNGTIITQWVCKKCKKKYIIYSFHNKIL